jgi:hypothetical protein
MRRVKTIRPPRWQAVAVAAGAALLATACGSSSTSSTPVSAPSSATSAAASSPAASSPAPSSTSALCQDVAALRASVDKLKHVTIGKGTVDELKADAADVKTKLGAVKTEAHGQAQAQISAMEDSLAKLQSAIKTVTSNFSVSAVSETVSAVQGVAASASSLLGALSKQCPSASASPAA